MKPETDTEFTKSLTVRNMIANALESGHIPFYNMCTAPPEKDMVCIELVLYSRDHLPLADKLLKKTLGQAVSPAEHECGGISGELYSCRYRIDFGDFSSLLIINTIFGQAFSAYSHFFGKDRGGNLSEEMGWLGDRMAELERYVSGIYRGTAGSTVEEGRDDVPFEESETAPEYDENLINPSEVMLYFQLHPSILERWISVAGENGISVCRNPVKTWNGQEAAPRGLVPLVNILRKRGIRDLLDLKEYFCANLESWEDIYRDFETARLNTFFRSKETTPFEFAWILLKASDLWNTEGTYKGV